MTSNDVASRLRELRDRMRSESLKTQQCYTCYTDLAKYVADELDKCLSVETSQPAPNEVSESLELADNLREFGRCANKYEHALVVLADKIKQLHRLIEHKDAVIAGMTQGLKGAAPDETPAELEELLRDVAAHGKRNWSVTAHRQLVRLGLVGSSVEPAEARNARISARIPHDIGLRDDGTHGECGTNPPPEKANRCDVCQQPHETKDCHYVAARKLRDAEKATAKVIPSVCGKPMPDGAAMAGPPADPQEILNALSAVGLGCRLHHPDAKGWCPNCGGPAVKASDRPELCHHDDTSWCNEDCRAKAQALQRWNAEKFHAPDLFEPPLKGWDHK